MDVVVTAYGACVLPRATIHNHAVWGGGQGKGGITPRAQIVAGFVDTQASAERVSSRGPGSGPSSDGAAASHRLVLVDSSRYDQDAVGSPYSMCLAEDHRRTGDPSDEDDTRTSFTASEYTDAVTFAPIRASGAALLSDGSTVDVDTLYDFRFPFESSATPRTYMRAYALRNVFAASDGAGAGARGSIETAMLPLYTLGGSDTLPGLGPKGGLDPAVSVKTVSATSVHVANVEDAPDDVATWLFSVSAVDESGAVHVCRASVPGGGGWWGPPPLVDLSPDIAVRVATSLLLLDTGLRHCPRVDLGEIALQALSRAWIPRACKVRMVDELVASTWLRSRSAGGA